VGEATASGSVLLRRLLGDELRRRRQRQGRTLREVSSSARVSLGYLSEVERGQKEASSELLAAICSALQEPLSHVLRSVSDELASAESAGLVRGTSISKPLVGSGGSTPIASVPQGAQQVAVVPDVVAAA